MSLYSINLTQTVSNPVLLNNNNPLSGNGGIIIPINDTPLGGPSYPNIENIQIEVDNTLLTLSNDNIKDAIIMPNNGTTSSTLNDPITSMNDYATWNSGPKINLFKQLTIPSLSTTSPHLMLIGQFNNVNVIFPDSYANFIQTPTIFHRWYMKRICWTLSGGVYVWYFETINNAPVCPA
jgi:hypothetical protein